MSQLAEEQEALEDLVQNKIDEDINTMFDDQIEKVEENADKQIEDLENTFTESKIAEMVANAIKTGVFEDIEGNVISLDQALMDFANNSTEYLGVMGESLKKELLENLGIALDTMSQIDEINKQLGNGKKDGAVYATPINITAGSLNSELAALQTSNNSITLGDMTITIQGNATQETVEDIKEILDEYTEKIKHEIMINVK